MARAYRPEALFQGARSREVIETILDMHFGGTARPNAHGPWIADLTWGKGAFWGDNWPGNVVGFDLAPRLGAVATADAKHAPLRDGAVEIAVFDPPFTFSRGKNPGSAGLVTDYVFLQSYEELLHLCCNAACEMRRIATKGAIVKLADSIKHGKFHPLHINGAEVMRPWLGQPCDIAILNSGVVRPEGPNWGEPKHLRNMHSYFLVYKWA